MDPISLTSLVASAVGVADIVTRLGFGLRHLQQEFSGALDHVDNIAQQSGTIDLAIREICSLLRTSPDTFPPSFESRLKESTTAIDKVVGQIQDHAQSVKTEAKKSPNKGKRLHLRHADKVVQWENNLGVQIQALSLLLQVAQLRSNDERTSVLEQDSSKRLFEKASSMSARIGNSSCTPSSQRPPLIDIKSFSFDPALLQTKVYRRACESFWKREVTVNGEDIGENTSASLSSVSSNHAIASQSGDSVPGPSVAARRSSGNSASRPEVETSIDHAEEITSPGAWRAAMSERRECQKTSPQLVSEASTSDTTQVTTKSSDTYATESTLATTISSLAQSKVAGESPSRSPSSLGKSMVLVVVEKVGSDRVELPVRNGPNHYNAIRDSISKVRDCILVAGGVDPATYRGFMASSTIETSGQAIHKFPFTATFLGAALEKMAEGFYSAIEILARFSTPTSSNDDRITTQIVTSRHEELDAASFDRSLTITGKQRNSSTYVPHFILDAQDVLPFCNKVLTVEGGFSEVYKVNLHPAYLRQGSLTRFDTRHQFAVKKLKSPDSKAFQREVEALKQLSSQPKDSHIIKLLMTFEHRQRSSNTYHLIFPYADGDLREFWKRNDKPGTWSQQSLRRSNNQLVLWVLQQCAGIADGLRIIHSVLNKPSDKALHSSARDLYGRHGDIKPDNILWFKDYNEASTYGTLKIADFGLSQFHSSVKKSRVKDAAKISCTPTYRAPECELISPDGQVSQAYDIWSLGCLYLEFVTWILASWNGVEQFRQERCKHVKDQAFFIIDSDGRFSINPSVTQQVQELQVKAFSLDPPMYQGLISFLTFVVSCLEVNEDKRPSAETLAEQFKELYTRLDKAVASKHRSPSLSQREETVSTSKTAKLDFKVD